MERNKGIKLFTSEPNYVVLDLETTGLSIYNSEIIEISALRIRDNKVSEEFSELIKPQLGVPETVTRITGISNDMLENKRTINEVLPDFIDFLGNDIILGHNIQTYDLNIIYDLSLDLLNKTISNDFIDLLYISQFALPLRSNKLSSVAKYFDVNADGAHRSLADCYITYNCYEKIKSECYDKKGRLIKCSIAPITTDDIELEFDIKGKNICVTGEFISGNKSDIENFIISQGASYQTSVTAKTDYLIMGAIKSEKWCENSLGKKYCRACELQDKGNQIMIIKESDIFNVNPPEYLDDYLSNNNRIYRKGIEPEQMLDGFCLDNELPEIIQSLKIKITNMLRENGYNESDISFRQSQAKTANNKVSIFITSSTSDIDNYKIAEFDYSLKNFDRFIFKPFDNYENKFTIKLRSDGWAQVDFKKGDLSVIDFVYEATEASFKNYTPSYTFGCCSKYVECSDNKECVYGNKLYARGCMYNKNLQSGKIFYGKNKNI